MCGIFFSSCFLDSHGEAAAFLNLSLGLEKMNALRGPDAQQCHSLSFPDGLLIPADNDQHREQTLLAKFYASELRLRGKAPIVQPHVRGRNVLCWNGEIFEGMEISEEQNDGVKLFDVLCSAVSTADICHIFSRIEGPYAFVFYHESSKRLYFGRDPLGRRSLLLHAPTQDMPYLLLSSVSGGANPAYDFLELPTESIYSFDLKSWEPSLDIHASFHQNLVANSRVPALSDVVLQSFAVPAKINITLPSGDIPQVKKLANIPQHLKHAVDDLIYQLDRSVMLQVSNIPYHSERNKARVAVLFSGGIDSTILTFLANKYIPLEEPIDLLNVAFENPRKIRVQQQGNIGGVSKRQKKRTHSKERNMEQNEKPVISYLVPDRVTGMQEVEELRRLCPGRTWNFVEINVPFEECQAARPLVESLMHPSRTVMDLSLALALFFASRGVGQIRKNFESDPEPYTSEAKVLINGLGSDELLGGYGRHRSVYSSGGWEAVINELQEEIDRIPTRNLGRDDRVISCHGKETRHPFLSLSLVSFLASLPVHFKMDPRLEPGIGDKMLLRLAARKIGLTEASSRKKRAMQFGSHSARMDGERRGDMGLDEAIS